MAGRRWVPLVAAHRPARGTRRCADLWFAAHAFRDPAELLKTLTHQVPHPGAFVLCHWLPRPRQRLQVPTDPAPSNTRWILLGSLDIFRPWTFYS